MVHDRELRNGTLVNLQERNRTRVRTPPVSAKIASAINLFLVYPIQSSIKNLWSTIICQCAFTTLHTEVFDIEVVTADKTDHAVSYTHLRAHETPEHLVCRLLLE